VGRGCGRLYLKINTNGLRILSSFFYTKNVRRLFHHRHRVYKLKCFRAKECNKKRKKNEVRNVCSRSRVFN
jgi:hypothetical protein